MKTFFTGLALSSALSFNQGHAAIFQFFFQDNYVNPAALAKLQTSELIAGTRWMNPVLKFEGTSGGGKGSAKSNVHDLFPFWFAATRVNDRFALGINFSSPFYSHSVYSQNSVVRFDATETVFYDYDINPHFCVKLIDELSIGAGFVANSAYNITIAFQVPGLGELRNRYSAWSYGWDVGFCYKINAKDTLEGAYFSGLNPDYHGTSSLGLVSNHSKLKLHLPALAYLRYSRPVMNKWFLIAQVNFSQWSLLKKAVFSNVPVLNKIVLPLNYMNTWFGSLINAFQIDRHWGITNVLFVDGNGAKLKSKTVNFPTCTVYGASLAGDYSFKKGAKVSAKYTSAFGNCPIDKPLGLSPTKGRVHIWFNVVELRFDYTL